MEWSPKAMRLSPESYQRGDNEEQENDMKTLTDDVGPDDYGWIQEIEGINPP